MTDDNKPAGLGIPSPAPGSQPSNPPPTGSQGHPGAGQGGPEAPKRSPVAPVHKGVSKKAGPRPSRYTLSAEAQKMVEETQAKLGYGSPEQVISAAVGYFAAVANHVSDGYTVKLSRGWGETVELAVPKVADLPVPPVPNKPPGSAKK